MNVEMKIYSTDFTIKKKELIDSRLLVLLKYDSILRIDLDHETVYNDWVCLLEMRHALIEWAEKLNSGIYETYQYISSDNDINPIFSFNYDSNKQTWGFVSSISNQPIKLDICVDDIKLFISKYRDELKKIIE